MLPGPASHVDNNNVKEVGEPPTPTNIATPAKVAAREFKTVIVNIKQNKGTTKQQHENSVSKSSSKKELHPGLVTEVGIKKELHNHNNNANQQYQKSRSKSDNRKHRNTNLIANHHQQQPAVALATGNLELNVATGRWPYCLVWTPIPFLTWFLPTIGHTGIANSEGIIYDFSDDRAVTVDNFSFGKPTKFYQFDTRWIPKSGELSWDQAIKEVGESYKKTLHGIFNNCHEYIAEVLNRVQYGNRKNWSQSEICWLITWNSSYVNYFSFWKQWGPMIIMLLVLFTVIGCLTWL